MTQQKTPVATLVPVSVAHQDQRVDLALPGQLPVAELLPGLVRALGRLTAPSATQGFRVLTPDGTELDQTRSLDEQDVGAGSVLTLQAAWTGLNDVRYDDLVEAVGTAVSAQRAPWSRDDSVQLSAFSASGLFVVAALMLTVFGTDPWPTAAVGFAGAVLAVLAAALLTRRATSAPAATAVALTAPVLAGAAASVLAPGPVPQLPAVAAGAGVIGGGLALLVLPARQRAAVAGPVVFGLGLLLLGLLTWGLRVETNTAAVTVIAAVALLTLLIPWIGLAQVPARIEGLSLTSTTPVDAGGVARQLENADVTVLSLRVAAGLLVALLTPLAAVDLLGALLVAAVAVANMLGTRSLRGHAEVFAGVTSGLLVAVVGAITLARHQPPLLPWVAAGSLLTGAFVLVLNVLGPKARPRLSRAADSVQVVALMAILPLTALAWGAL